MNREIEMAALQTKLMVGLTFEPGLWNRVVMRPDDFFDPGDTPFAKRTFSALRKRADAGKPIGSLAELSDAIFATEEESYIEWWRRQDLDLGPESFSDKVSLSWQRTLLLYKKERLIRKGGESLHKSKDESVLEALQRALADVDDRLDPPQQGIALGSEVAVQSVADGLADGEPTGWQYLDDVNAGWRKGAVVIYLARPSVGKTAKALESVRRKVSKDPGARILIWSTEMSYTLINQRAMQSWGMVTTDDVKAYARGGVLAPGKISEFKNAYQNVFVYRDAKTQQIRSVLDRMADDDMLPDMVVIDYLQDLTPNVNTGSQYQKVSEATGDVKRLAIELNVPVLLLSQISRKPRSETVTMEDARDTGRIEESGDVIVGLCRPNFEEEELARRRVVKVKADVVKNKFGDLSWTNLEFDRHVQRMQEATVEPTP